MIELIPLAYPSFQQSAECLSDGVLLALLRTMHGYYRHLHTLSEYDVPGRAYEVWRAWYRQRPAYVQFARVCYAEADSRGLECNEDHRRRMERDAPTGRWAKPLWVGWEELHNEYRVYLVHLGYCERIAHRACEYLNVPYSLDNSRATRWLEDAVGYRSFYHINAYSLESLERRLELDGAAPSTFVNHYLQYDWDSRDWEGATVAPPQPNMSYLVA